MKYVAFNPFKHLHYVESCLTVPISKTTKGIVALDSREMPCAVVLLDNWTNTAVSMHIAIQNPMALRKLFQEVAEYVFVTCDKQMVIGITESNHKKALRLNLHAGFKEIYRIKDCYDIGVDQIILQLKKEDCRFLTKRLNEAA